VVGSVVRELGEDLGPECARPADNRFAMQRTGEVATIVPFSRSTGKSRSTPNAADAAELKLNIGCGTSGIEGWVNIDNSPTILLSRLPFGRRIFRTPEWRGGVRRADVRKRIPFPDSSVSCIYSSHTFEHFTYEESRAVALECFRVLRVGGILRIVVPDLGLMVRDYLADSADPMASHTFVSRLLLTASVREIVHAGSHHKQMFDERSLAHLLQEAGFGAPEIMTFGSSRIAEISKIELESRRFESIYVEATK
jgi:predicted SAM-dependent methyltransferase